MNLTAKTPSIFLKTAFLGDLGVLAVQNHISSVKDFK